MEDLVTDYIVTSANIDDRETTWDLPDKFIFHTIFGDKGYTGADFAAAPKSQRGTMMLPLKKDND